MPTQLLTKNYLFPFAMVLAVVLVYAGLFEAEFINWDDGLYITDNRDVINFNVKNYFTSFYVGHYQPVTMLMYGLVYKISGDYPFSYHLLNVLIHAANGILLFYICRQFLGFGQAAFIVLLFCFHPMQVENIAWASELKTLLCVHFYLWAFVFYDRYMRLGMKKHYVFALCFFILASLSKPIAVTFPAFLLLVDVFRNGKPGRTSLFRLLPFFILAIITVLLSYYATQSGGFMPNSHAGNIGHKLVYAGNALGSYVFYFFAPLRLSAIYPYPEMNALTVTTGILVIVLYAFFLWLTFKKNRHVFFALVLFLVHIGIYLQLISFGEVLLADRYMYLAIPALAYLLVVLGGMLIANKKILTGLGLIVIMAGSGLAWKRTTVWKNNETFWVDLLDKFPESHVALSSKGAIHFQKKEYAQAADLLNRSITANPDYAPAHYNKGLLLLATNDGRGALAEFTRAILLAPLPKYLLARARLYYLNKEPDLALEDVEQCIQLGHSDVNVIGLKAMIYDDMGKPDVALLYYNQVLERAPEKADIVLRRGILYGKIMRFNDALVDFNKAIELMPQSGESYYWRAVARFSLKQNPCTDLQEAVAHNYAPATAALQKYCGR